MLMNRRRLVSPRRQLTKFQSPKPRRRRQKLHANPLAPLARLPLIHHAALLLFQSFRVRQNEHLPVVYLMLHHQQTPVRVHHHGLARLFELLSIVRPALRLQPHLVKRPTAATVGWRGCSAHAAIIGFFRKHRKLARRTGVPHKQPPSPGRPFDLRFMRLNTCVTLTKQKSFSRTRLLGGTACKIADGMSDSSLIPPLFVAMVLLG